MHDALTRAKEVCTALQSLITIDAEPDAKRSEAIDETITLCQVSLDFLESFFKGEEKSEDLQGHFTTLSDGLKRIWTDEG